MYKYRLTVMTPCYNRAYIIDNLYQSLLRQSDYDFEWLVIDDGSTDNIKEYIDGILKKDNPFEIKFVQKENGGKHTCINMATDIAQGKYFYIVDSDDCLPNDAMVKINFWLDSIERANDEKLIGIVGIKESKNLKHTFSTFEHGNKIEGSDSEYLDFTTLQREEYNIKGDKAEIIATDIIKKYKFPVFPEEKFVTEVVVWHDIAFDGYKFRWFNECIYNCEYLQDGLTKNMSKIIQKCPRGYIYTCYKSIKWYNYKLRQRLGTYALCYEMAAQSSNKKELIDFTKKLFNVSRFTLKFAYCLWLFKNAIKNN